MIDVENEIFTVIAEELRKKFSGIAVYGEDVLAPSSFPCVTIVEADNYTYEKTIDTGSSENHAGLMYEVNVYSNKSSGKKSECKEIFKKIDEMFLNMRFIRKGKTPYTLNNATVYRILGRYSAIISKDKTIFRR